MVGAELWGLFEEWLESLEDEIVGFALERGSVKADEVAERFKISRRAARVLLHRLQRKGRLDSAGFTPRAET